LFPARVIVFRKGEIGLGLRKIFSRLLHGGGFGLAFQFKQQLSIRHRTAARDGEVRERAAERRSGIDVFALDVALKFARMISRVVPAIFWIWGLVGSVGEVSRSIHSVTIATLVRRAPTSSCKSVAI